MGKTIDILNDVIYRNSTSYKIGYENKPEIIRQIEALEKIDLFNRYGMSYKYVEVEEHITVIIHKDLNFY